MAGQESTDSLGDVLVLGIGGTGATVAGYCADRLGGRVRSVTVVGGASSKASDATDQLQARGVRVLLGTEEVQGSYDLCVASPGIPDRSPFFQAACAHAREVIGEPEFAWRESPHDWVAITGTNGKTTTTTLTTALIHEAGLPAVAVGNIGTVATSQLDSRASGEWFVAELSSFQLATSSTIHPRVATLLNVTPDHVEWHGSLERYAAAKENLFKSMTPSDLAVVSQDDSWCRAITGRLEARGLRVLHLSVADQPEAPCAAFCRDGQLVVRLDGREVALVSREDLPIRGDHNVENALAASACALELGIEPAVVRRGLLAFHPLEHRAEPCGEVGGVRFVNDSKATNTDSAEKALTAFEPGSVVILLGGHDKQTDLSSLAAAVCRTCRVAVCFGEAGERMAQAVEAAASEAGAPTQVVRAPHMDQAFDAAVGLARPGDVVLLSPACSSFDEFANMAERGRAFKARVAALADGPVA